MIDLPERLRRLTEAEYPRFSDAEMERRRKALAGLMTAAGADHVVVPGANRVGAGVGWLTQWPVTTEGVVVFTPGSRDVMFVHYFNHLPLARKLAADADVRWAGESAIRLAVECVEAQMKDLGPVWEALAKPEHPDGP